MYSIVSEEIADFPKFLRDLLYFIASAGFAVPALVLLAALGYYLRLRAKGKRRAITQLRHWLKTERMDTIYLLREGRVQT